MSTTVQPATLSVARDCRPQDRFRVMLKLTERALFTHPADSEPPATAVDLT